MSDFENELKDLFEEAEFKPSERVWVGVESALTAKKKKGVFFYWQTYGIAAGIALLLTMTFLFNGERSKQTDKDQQLTKAEQQNTESSGDNKPTSDGKAQTDKEILTNKNIAQTVDALSSSKEGEIKQVKNNPIAQPNLTALNVNENRQYDGLDPLLSENKTQVATSFEAGKSLGTILLVPEPRENISIVKARWEMKHMVASMDLGVPALSIVPVDVSKHGLMVSGGIGGGSFNPNPSSNVDYLRVNQANLNEFSSSAVDVVNNGDDRPIGAISVGAGLGFSLTDRWGLRVGLRYSEYKFANESNTYSIENGVSLPVYIPAGYSGELFYVGYYGLTNSIKSVSLPVQATFKVFDLGKFDVSINGGVSADYFLSYEVKGDLNFLETRKVDFSENSLFNRFNFGAVTGLGLNYELNSQWGVAADIYYRKYIQPLSQESSFSSSPSVLGFGISFNYLIRANEEDK